MEQVQRLTFFGLAGTSITFVTVVGLHAGTSSWNKYNVISEDEPEKSGGGNKNKEINKQTRVDMTVFALLCCLFCV